MFVNADAAAAARDAIRRLRHPFLRPPIITLLHSSRIIIALPPIPRDQLLTKDTSSCFGSVLVSLFGGFHGRCNM